MLKEEDAAALTQAVEEVALILGIAEGDPEEWTIVGHLARLADAAERQASALEGIQQVLLERLPVR